MKGSFFDVEYGIRMALGGIYVISLFVSAVSLSNCAMHCADLHSILAEVTQCMVIATIPISIFHAWDHLSNFCKPKLQSQIVRIIWMVPVFCLESYFSMTFVDQAMYFQALRELYEAYVIHCFMRLILQYMGEEGSGQSVAARLENYPASMGVHKPPFCCLNPWQMGNEFVVKCKTGVFQYVVVRFFNTILTTVLFTLGLYEEGKYSVTKPFIWMTAANFVSQSWALYSLFLFFLCAHKELHGMRPFSKFLCIKLIIFFSWWQALLIGIMVRVGRINRGYGHSAQEIAVLIRVTIISCEMLVAAIAFMHAFPISEFPTPLLSKSTSRKGADGRIIRFSKSKHQEAAPLSVELTMPPLTDRLLLHASMIAQYWGRASTRSASPLATTPTKLPQTGSAHSYGKNDDSSGDSLTALLAESREESIAEEAERTNVDALGGVVGFSELAPPAIQAAPLAPVGADKSEGLGGAAPPRALEAASEAFAGVNFETRRQPLHRGSTTSGKVGCTIAEGATLISRSSPGFVRRDPASTSAPSYNQLRSKSTEKASIMHGVASSNLTAGRRAGSFTVSRALESDFDRHTLAPQYAAEDSCSASSSECSAGASGYQRFDAGLDGLNLSTLSYTPPVSSLGTQVKGKVGSRSASKGHGAESSAPSSSWFEALWISTMPADLQEDISDLEAQIAEIYTTSMPVAQIKRLIKGNNATY